MYIYISSWACRRRAKTIKQEDFSCFVADVDRHEVLVFIGSF